MLLLAVCAAIVVAVWCFDPRRKQSESVQAAGFWSLFKYVPGDDWKMPSGPPVPLSGTHVFKGLGFAVLVFIIAAILQEFRYESVRYHYGSPPVSGSLVSLALLAPLVALVIIRRSPLVRGATRLAWFRTTKGDDARGWTIIPFETNIERVRVRRTALIIAGLVSAYPLLVLINLPYGSGPNMAGELNGFPMLAALTCVLCWVMMIDGVTRRVPEWEGPARMEKIFVNGEWKWRRVGNPNGDPARDDPRAASASGPAKAGYVKTFNHETGEYEWRQAMAARDGDPNRPAPAAPFKPKGEHGDTPDLKPSGDGFL